MKHASIIIAGLAVALHSADAAVNNQSRCPLPLTTINDLSSSFTYGLELVQLDSKVDLKPDTLSGVRIGYAKDFGAWDKGFWTANYSLSYTQGEDDHIDVTHSSMTLGVDANFVMSDKVVLFVGPRLGMVSAETDIEGLEETTTDCFQMGLQAGVKIYFSEKRHNMTIGVGYMKFAQDEAELRSTTLYVGGSYAF